MTDVLQTTYWETFYNQILLKGVTVGATDDKSLLVQVMAWPQTGAKPLPEPMMTWFTYKCHLVSMCEVAIYT